MLSTKDIEMDIKDRIATLLNCEFIPDWRTITEDELRAGFEAFLIENRWLISTFKDKG